MAREEFVEKLQTYLLAHHYKKDTGEQWYLPVMSPGRPVQMIDSTGKMFVTKEPDIHVKFKVELVGNAEVAGTPSVQVLFEVSQEKAILMEYEEVFFYGENTRLEEKLKELHFIL